MTTARPLRAFEEARDRLFALCAPVAPRRLDLRDALGRIVAADVAAAGALPPRALALRDGYAMRSGEIAGASAYAPVALVAPPVFVRRGDAAPDGCDCLLDASAVEVSGPLAQAVQESYPGENLRRVGEDAPAGAILVPQGRRLTPADALALAQAGHRAIEARVPRVSVEGARGAIVDFVAREAEARGATLTEDAPDLVVLVGAGDAASPRLALEPGRDAVLTQRGATPVIVCPDAPDQALAIFHALIAPALDRLAARAAPTVRLRLARKIASRVGIAEAVLLRAEGDAFTPLATGDWPLLCWTQATHVAILEAASEGHAAGETIAATPFSEAFA